MTFKNTLKTLILTGALVFSGCEEYVNPEVEAYRKSSEEIVGTVVEERYICNSLQRVPEENISGFVSQAYSNETVKVGDSKYILKIKTDNGNVIGVNVLDDESGIKETLDSLVNEGSRIAFIKGNLYKTNRGLFADDNQTYFHDSTQMGNKGVSWFRVVDSNSNSH